MRTRVMAVALVLGLAGGLIGAPSVYGGPPPPADWSTVGNAGTVVGANFLGTTDDEPLEIKVNSLRALRIEPTNLTPNLIGGSSGNFVTAGVRGATVAGGGDTTDAAVNLVTDDFGTVGGGLNNRAGDDAGDTDDTNFATVAGGAGNVASGQRSSVGGGISNQALGIDSTVSGGADNAASGGRGTVGGGTQNAAIGSNSTVGGGAANTVIGSEATVGGGIFNTANGFRSTVSGGDGNDANGNLSVIGGGTDNETTVPLATIGGGAENFASGNSATIAGGGHNVAAGPGSAIGGGEFNATDGFHSFVGGGNANGATADNSTVSGGNLNDAAGITSTVGGGVANIAAGLRSTVAGGSSNDASELAATVAGGQTNAATAAYSAVGGGYQNAATGNYATVPGGNSSTAGGSYAFASGRRAKADHVGSLVWADSRNFDFASQATNQFSARATGGVRFVSGINLTTGAPTAGVILNPGSGSWSSLSDKSFKTAFRKVDVQEVLRALASLDVSTWSYKAQDGKIRHMGPVAQDFFRAFGLGESARYISSVDADGVSLASIKALYEIVVSQRDVLTEQSGLIDALRLRIEALERDR